MHWLLEELGWPDESGVIIAWTFVFLIIGFGPLLVSSMIGASGLTERFLGALGPVLVSLGFAGLTLKYGMRYASEMKWSAARIWFLVAMFVALAAIVGWGLFVSL